MEFLVEVLGELFFEGILEVIQNEKITKWLRYPLFFLVCCFYLALLGIFCIIGIQLFRKKEILGGFVIMLICFFLFILCICFFKKISKK